MMQLFYKRNDFSFEYPFHLAHGLKTSQKGLVIALKMGAFLGLGEATEINYYPDAYLDTYIDLLEKNRATIERYAIIDPERFWHFLHHLIPNQHFLINALDCAGWDIYGKMKGKPVHELLGLTQPGNQVSYLSDYTIGILSKEDIVQRAKEKVFPIYKLKVGGEHDLDSVRALRLHTQARIRIDANEAWNTTSASMILPALNELDIECIEQPLPRKENNSMSILRKLTHIPFIADESCHNEQDLSACSGLFDGVNIKLAKCGGLTPAFKWALKAKKEGFKIMLGCMSEGNTGTAAAAQLLPLADYIDLDGPLILKDSFTNGLAYNHTAIELNKTAGLGTSVK